VSCLIKGSEVIDPPWPEDAWERATEKFIASEMKNFNLFDTWVQAAPKILDFSDADRHALDPLLQLGGAPFQSAITATIRPVAPPRANRWIPSGISSKPIVVVGIPRSPAAMWDNTDSRALRWPPREPRSVTALFTSSAVEIVASLRPRPTWITRPSGRTALIASAVVVLNPAKSTIMSTPNPSQLARMLDNLCHTPGDGQRPPHDWARRHRPWPRQ
jgi:hypothetical protein